MDSQIFTENGRYLMFAFDHRESFKKFINSEDPDKVTEEEAFTQKRLLIDSVKDKFSGILIDPEYGLKAYQSLDVNKPYLLPIEKSGSVPVNGEKTNVLERNANDIKNMGASGVKILIYFNPDLDTARQQLNTSKQALEDSHNNSLPFFLEIVTYDMGDETRVLRSIQNFLDNHIVPDVFKIEFPGSDYLCQRVTSVLGATPWIMLTRAANYALFKEQLKIACENGCRGFLAGRSLWQEYFDTNDATQRLVFLDITLPSRFDEIRDIVLNS
ncbi:DUF2090 domain-containing protein [Patescibacteria group bacterium]|nr:DUF2090 domain-containing protein [Patescibacteria group bacterium]